MNGSCRPLHQGWEAHLEGGFQLSPTITSINLATPVLADTSRYHHVTSTESTNLLLAIRAATLKLEVPSKTW